MTLPNEMEPGKLATDYLWVLRKHLWLITGIFLVTVITVAIWTFLADADLPGRRRPC